MEPRAARPSPGRGFPAFSKSLPNSVKEKEGQTPKPSLHPPCSCGLGSIATSSVIPKHYGATESMLRLSKKIFPSPHRKLRLYGSGEPTLMLHEGTRCFGRKGWSKPSVPAQRILWQPLPRGLSQGRRVQCRRFKSCKMPQRSNECEQRQA